MLTFRKDLIVGESLKGKERKIVPNIKRGKIKKKGVTLITYAANGKDLFDLIPAKEMKYPVRQEQQSVDAVCRKEGSRVFFQYSRDNF